MAHYVEDYLGGPAIGARRPTINEYFLSSYTMAVYVQAPLNHSRARWNIRSTIFLQGE